MITQFLLDTAPNGELDGELAQEFYWSYGITSFLCLQALIQFELYRQLLKIVKQEGSGRSCPVKLFFIKLIEWITTVCNIAMAFLMIDIFINCEEISSTVAFGMSIALNIHGIYSSVLSVI